jgi:GNAT superfamily N-acetyltransferase
MKLKLPGAKGGEIMIRFSSETHNYLHFCHATIGNLEVGHVCYQWYELDNGRPAIYIRYIEVRKSFQRKGIGSLLMSKVSSLALSKRRWTIVLDNCTDAGNTFYDDLGFHYTQEGDNEMWIKSRDLL